MSPSRDSLDNPSATTTLFCGFRLGPHPDFAMLDGETIGHGQTFDRCGDQERGRRAARCARASRRVAFGVRPVAGTFGTATRCDK